MANDTSLPPNNLREITMWHLCGLSLCNFDCYYCASGIPGNNGRRTKDREWENSAAENNFQHFITWLEKQPYSIGLRLQTIGEPFVSRSFLKGAAKASHYRNIRFLELVTNGSLLTKRLPFLLEQYEADADKLSLWITYHHSEINAEELIKQVIFAKAQGVNVIINCLLFPDNLDEIKHIINLCKLNNIRFNIDLGRNLNDSYPGQPHFAIIKQLSKEMAIDLEMDLNTALCSVIARRAPKGFRCSAGHDYVYIDSEGSVFPCRPYRNASTKEAYLGSILDPSFVLDLREEEYQRCIIQEGCSCKEDFMHMKLAREPFAKKEPSLGLIYPGTPPSHKKEILERILL